MHSVIRGKEAWERLGQISSDAEGLEVANMLTDRQEEFLAKLEKAKRNGNLLRIVTGMHARLIRAHNALPEMMVCEDTYPWRHQVMFVWNERWRQETRPRGIRYWLPTLLQFKLEDVDMPPDEIPELTPEVVEWAERHQAPPPVLGGGPVDLDAFTREEGHAAHQDAPE